MEQKNAIGSWLDVTPAGGSPIASPDTAPTDRVEPAMRQLTSLAEWRRQRAARREARNAAT
jgi:hypothetical protein